MIKKEILGLKGANVRIFGQPTKLNEEYGELMIDAIDVIDSLMPYEKTDLSIETYNSENDEYETFEVDTIDEYLQFMEDEYGLQNTGSDNTYNWSSPITHDFYFHTYENKESGNTLMVIAFHLYGDVRGNYTVEALLEFNNFEEFIEVLMENNKYLGIKEGYEVQVDIFNDICEVYSSEGDYIGYITDLDDLDALIS